MDPLISFLLFTSAVTGALFYRMRGGAPSWPRPLEQILFCTVFGVAMAALGVPFGWQVLAFALAVVACLTGHGQYFLAMTVKPLEPERLDFAVAALFGPDPRCDEQFKRYWDHDGEGDVQWMEGYADAVAEISKMIKRYGRNKLFTRCAAGMGVTGLAVSLAPGLAVALTTPHIWAGMALALSGGLTKPLAYLISAALGKGTEGGEYGHGALQWFVATLVAVLVVT